MFCLDIIYMYFGWPLQSLHMEKESIPVYGKCVKEGFGKAQYSMDTVSPMSVEPSLELRHSLNKMRRSRKSCKTLWICCLES